MPKLHGYLASIILFYLNEYKPIHVYSKFQVKKVKQK